ncbi:hypothetical protein D3C74_186100 [compost metagenome]
MFIENAMGKINISKQIITKIILKSANAIAGITYTSNGIIENITSRFGGNSSQHGIELKETATGLDIHLCITIQHRLIIPEVCKVLQSNVRETIENFTGVSVDHVNVTIVGVSVD